MEFIRRVINVIDRQMDNSVAGAVRRGYALLLQKWGSYAFLRMEEV